MAYGGMYRLMPDTLPEVAKPPGIELRPFNEELDADPANWPGPLKLWTEGLGTLRLTGGLF